MSMASNSRPQKVVCPQVPPGLTDEKLASYYAQRADPDDFDATRLPADGSGGDDISDSESDDSSVANNAPLYGKYTLMPDTEAQPFSPYDRASAAQYRPPTNTLLHLYSGGRTREEGMARVANYIGEFMCLVRTEVSMAGLFVMPCSGTYGHASLCGDHWYLGAPMHARLGFVLPSSGSWQDTEKTLVNRGSSQDHLERAMSVEAPIAAERDKDKERAAKDEDVRVEGDDDVTESEPDLAIYVDDAPVTREANRFFKDSEILQAQKDIKTRHGDLQNAEAVIKKIDWHARKRTCHLHLCASLYEQMGNTNFQEIPDRLHSNRLRIVGWPADCDLPPTHIGHYNAEKVRHMLLALWRGTFKLEPWEDDEQADSFPPLVVDNTGKEHRFMEHLTQEVDEDTSRNATPASGLPTDSEGYRDAARQTPLTLPDPTPAQTPTRTPTPDAGPRAIARQTQSYLTIPSNVRAATGTRQSAKPSPERDVRSTPDSAARPQGQGDVYRDYRRSWKDSELVQGIKDIKDHGENLQDAENEIQELDWNTRRRTCHLHICSLVYEHLGNTNFQEIPRRLHKCRLRIVGWPAVCELPSNSNVSLYNKEKVKTMLLALWHGKMRVEPWAEDERPETLPPLFIDSKGKKHRLPKHVVEDSRGDLEEDSRPMPSSSTKEVNTAWVNPPPILASSSASKNGTTGVIVSRVMYTKQELKAIRAQEEQQEREAIEEALRLLQAQGIQISNGPVKPTPYGVLQTRTDDSRLSTPSSSAQIIGSKRKAGGGGEGEESAAGSQIEAPGSSDGAGRSAKRARIDTATSKPSRTTEVKAVPKASSSRTSKAMT